MLYPNWAAVWADFPFYYTYYCTKLSNVEYDLNVATANPLNVTGWNSLIGAIAQLMFGVEGILGDRLDTFDTAFGVNLWYYAHQSTVDMPSILNAMLAAEFDELTQFVGIEDAYRSAIWDQPFNSQFYAALAAGFRANL